MNRGFVIIKLMQLGVTNGIVADLDSKPADFDRQFASFSKSNDGLESTIANLIYFNYKIDLEIKQVN